MPPLPNSHMFKMSHLKKKISLESYYSAADILNKLEELTGLVYLQDDNNPVIGFLQLRTCSNISTDTTRSNLS